MSNSIVTASVAAVAASFAFLAGLALARPPTAVAMHAPAASAVQLTRPFTTAGPRAPPQSVHVRSAAVLAGAERAAETPVGEAAPAAVPSTPFSAAAPAWVALLGVALGAAGYALQRLQASRGRGFAEVPHAAYGANVAMASYTGTKAPQGVPPARDLRLRAAAEAAVVDVEPEGTHLEPEPTKAEESGPAEPPKPHVAVVGAGWGGWAACKALVANGCRVTLLDSLPDPTGATPYLTPTGKPFEVGVRGFWKDYPNIESMLSELGIPESDVFTEFTNSQFWSPDGLEATAPVFSSSAFPQLPSPLGQVFATFENFKRLPVEDRVTMAGLLYAMLDLNRDQATFEAYDRMTAHELFLRMGLSKRLVDDFVRPTLLVGLFKPPEELSAAVAMELLYFYALAHQTSFDVRWLKQKSVSEALINPLADSISAAGDITVCGKSRVQEIVMSEDGSKVSALRYTDGSGQEQLLEVDACVLALGVKGLKGVMSNSPVLSKRCPDLAATTALNGIDVMTCRIWLDRYIATEAPANVLSRFEGLRGAGGTFFMLDQLQPDKDALWGGETPQGSVLACDFYNSSALNGLSNEDIIDLLMKELLPAAIPDFARANVVDSHVARFPGAVTWFSPGSFRKRPPLETNIPNLVCAGDIVRMGDREHGAKGLCQERAYVSGLEAANCLARKGQLGSCRAIHPVIPIREDEPQVQFGREVNKRVMDALNPLGLASPWVR